MTKHAKKTEATGKPRESAGSDFQRALTRLIGVGLLVALLSVIVMMVAAQFFPEITFLNAPRRVLAQAMAPVQKSFSFISDGVADYLRGMKYQSNLEHEYEQLRIAYDEMVDKTMRMEQLEYELQQFADLEDEMVRNSDLNGVKATIIGRDTSNYTFTLTIDVGSNDGIGEHMAVVYSGALVGYVEGVEPHTAKVRGIVDSNASVHALIESSRDTGQIKGTLAIDGSYACRMYYLSYTTLPRPGDRVVTSGMGMEFIKGIPVGYVRESTRGLEDSKQFIVVEPIVDFNHLEYVIVYRYRPANPEPAEERGSQVSATLVPLPSTLPVPTFIGQRPPEVTPGPDGIIPLTASPEPAPTPTPGSPPDPTADPNATAVPDNLGYNVKPVVVGTPTPEPTPTPTPSPVPAPTFSVDQQTVEDDE